MRCVTEEAGRHLTSGGRSCAARSTHLMDGWFFCGDIVVCDTAFFIIMQESVSCIHGMRVFSMLWTIMVHTYLQTFGISENKFGRVIKERTMSYQIIGNATYSVDTFFFLRYAIAVVCVISVSFFVAVSNLFMTFNSRLFSLLASMRCDCRVC